MEVEDQHLVLGLTEAVDTADPLFDLHRVPRQVVVDDRRTELEVEALAGHPAREQHVELAAVGTGHQFGALVLVDAAVHDGHRHRRRQPPLQVGERRAREAEQQHLTSAPRRSVAGSRGSGRTSCRRRRVVLRETDAAVLFREALSPEAAVVGELLLVLDQPRTRSRQPRTRSRGAGRQVLASRNGIWVANPTGMPKSTSPVLLPLSIAGRGRPRPRSSSTSIGITSRTALWSWISTLRVRVTTAESACSGGRAADRHDVGGAEFVLARAVRRVRRTRGGRSPCDRTRVVEVGEPAEPGGAADSVGRSGGADRLSTAFGSAVARARSGRRTRQGPGAPTD